MFHTKSCCSRAASVSAASAVARAKRYLCSRTQCIGESIQPRSHAGGVRAGVTGSGDRARPMRTQPDLLGSLRLRRYPAMGVTGHSAGAFSHFQLTAAAP